MNVRICRLLLFLFFNCISLLCFADIDKNLSVTIGESFKFSPWSDLSSKYSGYSCVKTYYRLPDNTAFTISESSRVSTTYPKLYEKVGYDNGYYCSYKAKALKTGTYIIYGYAQMAKRDGIDFYTGTITVIYHVTVSEEKVVTSISIPSYLEFSIGDTYTYTPKITESGAKTTLSWTSSNKSIVSVTNNGVITANSVGDAEITCTASNGVYAKSFIKVNPIYISSITLSESEIEIIENERFNLSATISPLNATIKELIWTSSNEDVAFVTSKGVVIGLSTGYSEITVYAKDGSGKSASCLVHVIKDKPNLKGDINDDGFVDISDIVAVINTIASNTINQNKEDVNEDGKVDISDIVAIINIIAKK